MVFEFENFFELFKETKKLSKLCELFYETSRNFIRVVAGKSKFLPDSIITYSESCL
jgi:hypothetical protein